MTYNANGNILTKSDISSATAFGYGISAGPYALTGVTSSTNVIPSTSQTATYTSFEKVSTLTEGVYSAAFAYNSDIQRAKMDITQSGSTILTRWYVGSRYMKETAAGVTKEYTYIGGDAYNAPVAAVSQSGTTTYYYLLRDYLGNITHQVNTSNTVVAEYNFDAWGRRRSADDWSYTMDANDLTLFADRGFTGHEHLTLFNLVNMNGRLYDPLVGRFLNVDPYVQMPDYTQNVNRYSYCLNNPLKFTDPNGEFIPFLVIAAAAVISGSINVAVHWKEIKAVGGGWSSFWKGAGYFGVGAAAGAGAAVMPELLPILGTGAGAGAALGFAGGFITGAGNAAIGGGNLGDIFMSGLMSGGMGALTGGAIGGGSALLRGKNFWTGHDIGFGRSAFALDNSAKFAPGKVACPKLDANLPQAELNVSNARTQLSPMSESGQTIVGEGMSRVEAAAANNPGSVILNDMPAFSGTSEQVTSKMMQYNRQWILDQMRSSRPILDIGLDLNRATPSIFYQMEQNMMKNYQILHPGSLKIIKP
jgi:RHS repeat-associated protein